MTLAACQVGPIGKATPSPSPSPAPSILPGIPATDPDGPAKVAMALFPDGGHACGATNGDYSACPVTPALKMRLNAHPLQYSEQLCRCTTAYSTRTFDASTTQDGALVRVTLALSGATQRLDVATDKSAGSWLASDLTCGGYGTSTSIFSDAPTLCFAPS